MSTPIISAGSLHAVLTAPPSALDVAMQRWWLGQGAPHTLAVALSGGADSTAILLATLRLGLHVKQGQVPIKGRKSGGVYGNNHIFKSHIHVIALHIHHGLQTAADAFAQHVQALCTGCVQQMQALCAALPEPNLEPNGMASAERGAMTLSCLVQQVHVPYGAGDSLEEQARRVRYQALADMARAAGASHVLLGHHADDQVESVLLALGRGAGVAGLAGMGVDFVRHNMSFARPLLGLSGTALRQWLRQYQVGWIDDPSNADMRFTRNHIRQQLLPVLEQIVPAFRSSVARSAQLAAEADSLLVELAQLDLVQVGLPPRLPPLRGLSRARQVNVLRYWLKTAYGVIGSHAQMQALLDVLAACRTRGHRVHIKVGCGYVQRVGDCLQWHSQSH